MALFQTLRPHIDEESLLQHGTDLDVKGRLGEILSYNHFKKKDYQNLMAVTELIRPSWEKAAGIFTHYLNRLNADAHTRLSESNIVAYFQTFFTAHRDIAYKQKVTPHFFRLKEVHNNIGELIVAFNQTHSFFMTLLMSNKKLSPTKRFELMESLQKAANVDQQLLTEFYNEKLLEDAAIGISQLLAKNAEIMFVKDFLRKLEEQDREIQSSTAAGEQLAASVDEVATNTTSVAQSSTETVKKSENGKTVIENALAEIEHTRRQFESVISKREELQQAVKNIENVIGIIKDIADQTNLLALNASIEAARAGEAGKGFSVVASEVRKLAETTVSSVQSVTENVADLQSISAEIGQLTDKTSHVIENGVKEVQVAVPLLTEIMESMNQVNDDTNHTATIAQQQAAAVTEVAQRLVSITELTDDVRVLGENTGRSIHELSKLTEEYRTSLFSKYTHLSTRTLLELAKSDHILWKWRIYNMMIGLEDISPEDVSSHKVCRLGKWYFAPDTAARLKNYQAYVDMDEPHQKVHESARKAAEAYQKGDLQKADDHLKRLETASDQVLMLIDQLIEELSI